MNLYNVMVNYDGEGSTNIFIPSVGDTIITHGRPIYIKNASFNVIEALRQFRVMQISIQINAKQEGAFRIIDLGTKTPYDKLREIKPSIKEEVTESDIASVLKSGTNGPIPVPEKPKVEKDFGSYVLKSGSFAGKTLAEVDKLGKLKAVYNGYKTRNKEVKEAIEKYYESQLNK